MADGKAKPKTKADGPYFCRRPYCAREHATAVEREVHEYEKTALHLKHGMDFICTWDGHADAIGEHGFCPVCQ